jgi:hypothetical protein
MQNEPEAPKSMVESGGSDEVEVAILNDRG